MPKQTEQLETKILKLFGTDSHKIFYFETLIGLLPQKTRKEKLIHSLDILKKQKKIKEVERFKFQLVKGDTKDNVSSHQEVKPVKLDKPKSKFIPNQKVYEGIIDISNTSGAVFVIIEGVERDAIFRQREMPKVFQGDRVKVSLSDVKPGKRPEATLVDVIERKVHKIIGKVHKTERDTFVEPLSRKIKQHFYIAFQDTKNAENDQYVLVEFKEWNLSEKSPRGRIIEILDGSAFHNIEMESILIEKGFQKSFDPKVIEELNDVSKKIEKSELSYRLDYRNVTTLTIDPADARDFDDAISLQKLENGNYEIGVHIADVSHFVKPHTEVDKEAFNRATSVYLPDRVAPMLPELLSNDLCSLNPKVERYAFAAIFEMDENGKIINEKIAKTVIKSNHRFSYEEAQEIIETQKGNFAEEILFLDKIAKIWRAERYKKGAIKFATTEVRFKFDDKGVPIEVYEKVQKDSNLLIEDFMLKANVCVATFLSNYVEQKKIHAGVYRNHDLPSLEKLQQFSETAFRLGKHKVKSLEDPKKAASVLNAFLDEIKDTPEAPILNQLAIRSMAKANYSTTNIGHYGLGYAFYTHFTSPIRRYPDLLVHRLLDKILYQTKYNYPKDILEQMCQHCSIQEKNAADCEREGIKYKQVEYLSYRIGKTFQGIISGAIQSGFWVELIDNKCEGFVELAAQFKEEFVYDAQKISLTSSKGKRSFFYGDVITIEVAKVHLRDKKVWFKVVD